MLKSSCASYTKNLFGKGMKFFVLVVLTAIYVVPAMAKVCFLPGGKCPGDINPNDVRGIQGEQCIGYNLTQEKCKGQACSVGWHCENCVNAQGSFYKCDIVPTPKPNEGGGDPDTPWTPGLEKCPSPCQHYDYYGFTGNQINGKCGVISDFKKENRGNMNIKPEPCHTYITPNYMCGVKIEGESIISLTKDKGDCKVCYANVEYMEGYSTNKPESCTTYNYKRDGLGTENDNMCYTVGVSIGDHFTTDKNEHFPDIFDIEEGAGTDNVTCYRAKGCNSVNGWSDKSPDTQIFEVETKTTDGKTCYRAKGCNANNSFFEEEQDTTYFVNEKYSASAASGYKGITCYRATKCNNYAYTSLPDARYFKSASKTSNNHTCWIVTGKSDYAYYKNDRKLNYFDYTPATAYINGTAEQGTYYIVNKDSPKHGCMQYAYEEEQDTRYFINAVEEQYSNGSSTKKKCWIVTGKAKYAYYAKERKLTFFDYTDETRYLNGTSNQGTYYIVNKDSAKHGCMQYAYEEEQDTRYFTNAVEEQYSNGSATKKKCWNITDKGQYAYRESEQKTKFFTYDAGKEGYLNGTSKTERYYNISSCSIPAYPSKPDVKCYSSVSESGKKGGVNTDITCWNITAKGQYAYKENERILNYFDYDACATAYINGDSSKQETFYLAKQCMKYAYTSEPDSKYFTSEKKTQNKLGEKVDLNCWNITGKGKYAYTEAEKKTLYFTYDAGKSGYLKGTSTVTEKYFNVTGRPDGAYETSPSKDVFNVSKQEAYKGGVDNIIQSWRATDCNGKNYYTATKPEARYFSSNNTSASGITCYIATGCASSGDVTSTKPGDCRIYQTAKDEFKRFYCYYNIGWVGGDSKATKTNPGDCMRYSSGNDTNGGVCYYNVASLGTGYSTSTLDTTYFDVEEATGTNGKKCYRAKNCATGASKTSPNTSIFIVDNKETSNVSSGSTLKCYRATDCNSSKGSTSTKPDGCRTWSSARESGITCYYNISAEFGKNCVIAGDRVNCYKYSGPKNNTDGIAYYYDPVLMHQGAVDVKPSVTSSNCHTFSSGNPSAYNGTKTTCYWNDEDVTSYKPSSLAHCGVCGKKTRTPTCNSDGTGWNAGTYGSCTEFTKPSTSQICGTCGTQSRSPQCKNNGTGWTEPDWGTCNEISKPISSRACGCGGKQSRDVTCNPTHTAWNTGDWGKCSNECSSGYHCNGDANSGTCVPDCIPAANETSDKSTCKTTSYSCSDGCGGTRTCYKSSCKGDQRCVNGICVNGCTPLSDEAPNKSLCKTTSYSCSDGCGGTRTCYKSSCSSTQTCSNGVCTGSCTPLANESRNTTYCLTVSYSCSDGCGGTRTCYKSACASGQTCNNGSCSDGCTPLSNESSDSSSCKTTSYSCSDGCGGTRTCYKSSCSSSQTCSNGTCVDSNVPDDDDDDTSSTSSGTSCTPLSSESSDSSSCKTTSYSCSDGCGGTRTCYKSSCSSGQTCYNSSCCTPSADESSDSSSCKTTSYSCSDGCGGTRTCYKSSCTSTQTCENGTCKSKSCGCSGETTTDCTKGGCILACTAKGDDGCGNTCYQIKWSATQGCNYQYLGPQR